VPLQIEPHQPMVPLWIAKRRPDDTMLTTMGASGELFHTATGTAYADLLIDGHRETWPIRNKRFRSWLRRSYKETTPSAGTPLPGQLAGQECERHIIAKVS
jgi:hypothetical protein